MSFKSENFMNFIKKFFKSFAVAFSLYSKIPMPKFTWGSSDMSFHLCFFSLIGLFIALIEYVWNLIFVKFSFNQIFYVLISIFIPILITGGFHLDGFMDTMDAINSYQSKDKKLEILKDSHIGAFSVISVISYFLLAIAFSFLINNFAAFICIFFSFIVSRILSGLSVVCFPKAKSQGMLFTESESQNKKFVKICLIFELILTLGFLIFINLKNWKFTLGFCLSFIFSFLYYFFMSKNKFGGITGDLAGFFVCISELSVLIVMGFICLIF